MAPFYKHGFSTDNKEILGPTDIRLIQQIYGKPKNIVFNSRTATVVVKQSSLKPGKVKIVVYLKPKYSLKALTRSLVKTLTKTLTKTFKSWWQNCLRERICQSLSRGSLELCDWVWSLLERGSSPGGW